jgi:hypothetical protein
LHFFKPGEYFRKEIINHTLLFNYQVQKD